MRSKRFRSSYCAKVRAGARKKKNGERGRRRGEEETTFPSSSPSPVIPFFFCSRPNVLDELARKRLLHRLNSDLRNVPSGEERGETDVFAG